MNYKNLLYKISNTQKTNSSNIDSIIIPKNKQLYMIDLNTRKIQAPEKIGVQSEHYAETIYFLVDRYYDSMDLAQTNCVIQYVINNKCYIYTVPFCDITSYENKMIIPWNISISATKKPGFLQFFLRFYLIDKNSIYDENNNYNPDNAQFSYSLSTLLATTKIEKTLSQDDFIEEQKDFLVSDEYFSNIDYLNTIVDNATVYWLDV